MFDVLYAGFLVLLVATVMTVAVVGITTLLVGIARESGWASCLCAAIGLVGVAFLTIGVTLWGQFIPTSTISFALGFIGWTILMLLSNHEIGKWVEKRMRNNAMRRHPSYK
jgi:hypothetical protein